jgi:hypothetical protein
MFFESHDWFTEKFTKKMFISFQVWKHCRFSSRVICIFISTPTRKSYNIYLHRMYLRLDRCMLCTEWISVLWGIAEICKHIFRFLYVVIRLPPRAETVFRTKFPLVFPTLFSHPLWKKMRTQLDASLKHYHRKYDKIKFPFPSLSTHNELKNINKIISNMW